MIKICYFGVYDSHYSRNKILMRGLEENGAEIIICNSRLIGYKKYFDLIKKHWGVRKQYDVMMVGFPGQRIMPLVRLLTKKPIIFDAFISLYDTEIFDRKRHRPKSLRGIYYWILDWLSCQLADEILVDTQEHINYFKKEFKIRNEKIHRVFVGSDDKIFSPSYSESKRDYFLVHFHGTFIPLQGIEYIIRAAAKLQNNNVYFNIIGKGQTYNQIRQLADETNVHNVRFIDFVPYDKLKNYMNNADICLGIFGNTKKAGRVIPNKVYEALAARCPCITGDSPAIRELLIDRENILLSKMADENDLADKILDLINDTALRKKIADKGYELFLKKLLPKMVTEEITNFLQKKYAINTR